VKVIWSAASVRHLQEIVEYLQGESAVRTISNRRRILAAVKRLAQAPNIGREGRIEGTREVVVPRSPYIVVYRLSAQQVEILGIWHGARQWPEAF
jgi:toxin ParE1/3/4